MLAFARMNPRHYPIQFATKNAAFGKLLRHMKLIKETSEPPLVFSYGGDA